MKVRLVLVSAVLLAIASNSLSTWAQSSTSGSIEGVVKDPSGAIIPQATVEISNPVSGFRREATTGDNGSFRFVNVPFNPYHLAVAKNGFASSAQDVEVRSAVPITLQISLKIGQSATTVTVEANGEDLVDKDPTFHTDVDRGMFDKIPLESQSSSVSSLVTLSSPGVVADSNGLFHGLGDHAENSFSVDGQPITDQQSKVFSNQIPVDSIQSMEVIGGAPPAEYGEKTSLVIKVTTRSGMGQKKPSGTVTTSYGSFGSVNGGANVSVGGDRWGNFVAVNGLNTGRFLDPPEFQVMHSKGNQQNLFDRVDFGLSKLDTIQMNLGYTRSWFQTPNSFDAEAVNQDQRSQIQTYNFAPTWTHLFGSSALFTFGGFVRHDGFNYYPSGNPFADQPETLSQHRKLTNMGLRSDYSYAKGIHNIKTGITFQHTLLSENFAFGITDPSMNAVCLDASGNPDADPNLTDPSLCVGPLQPNPNFLPQLLLNDLTRGGTDFTFRGHRDIKQLALYLQDTISKGPWNVNLGIRGDIYSGFTSAAQPEPRVGVAYNIKRTNTVLRASYARIMETPFNENLVFASQTNPSPVVAALFGATAAGPIDPGLRNEFHAGFQQAFGKSFVVDADYLWKYTHNGYDFADLLNTPIFFPVAWHNSKIQGASVRISMPTYRGLTAFVVLSSVSARFFPPQIGGLGADDVAIGPPFRIDHDQKLQQTTHLQYQPWKAGPWFGFNWRYDSGGVAGGVPFAADTTTPVDLRDLTADQQIQAGLFCGNVFPTFSAPLTTCAPSQYGSTRINLPAPGTENDDHNPPRIAPRNLFDAAVGHDDLFKGDRYKWSLNLTAVNLTNKVALYNFLSTFSGTHFVTPRTISAELGFHF